MTDLFIKIADKLGLTLQPKRVDENDYTNTENLSISAMLSDRLSTLTLTDSTIAINGDSARAKFLNDFATRFWNESIKMACVTSLGTGDCLLKPSTDGKHFAVDIIGNSDFSITEYIGSYVYGMLIKCDEIKQGNSWYQRVEYHRIREVDGVSCCHIYQMAFKNGKEVPLSSVDAWAEFPPEIIIPNVDRLLLGRIKSPVKNRTAPNSPNGVPITYGLDNVVFNVKDAYQRFNKEYRDKETLIFADKSMFKKDENGETYIPKGKSNLFMKFRSGNIDNSNIDTFSPEIRDTSLDNGIERNFRMLEMGVGLGEGVLSKSTLTYTNVDEVRASRSATYAFMTNFRKSIDQAAADLLYAVNVLCNANNITPLGSYKFVSDWSDTYITTTQETFNELLQCVNIDAVSKAELRSWVMNEDMQVSEEKIAEMEKNNPPTMEMVTVPAD